MRIQSGDVSRQKRCSSRCAHGTASIGTERAGMIRYCLARQRQKCVRLGADWAVWDAANGVLNS